MNDGQLGEVRILNGRYELGEVLGSGGMGRVYRALDRRLGRPVAVKLLRTVDEDGADEDGAPGNTEHRRRLAAEAEIAASLRHPAIAQVHDHDEDQDSTHRTPFVVMELVEGVTLARLLRDRGALTWEQTVALVRELASALAYLQAHGVVHRDLKPANIMLTPEDRVVLLDFGIARADTSTALTTTGTMLGTVEFLSPEQIGGAQATASSDLYALGLVAHTCLTGRSPFRRSSPIATAWAQVNDALPDLPASVPPVVRRLVASLAAKAVADRPADASTVLRAIDDLGLTLALPPVDTSDLPEVGQVEVTRTAALLRRRPRWMTLGAAAAAAVAVALLLAGEPSPSVAESPEATADAGPTPTPSETATPEPTVETAVVNEPEAPAPVTPAPVATLAPVPPGQANGNGNANGNTSGNANGNTSGKANGNANGSANANGHANGNKP